MIYSRPETIISDTRLPISVLDKLYKDSNKIPPACGGLGGYIIRSRMLKDLKPGDHIFNLEKKTAPVKDLKFDRYNGPVLEILLNRSNQIHLALPENLVLCQRNVDKISDQGEWKDIPKLHFQRARQLRSQSTPPEKKLWQYLRSEQLGVKFRSQHPINRYIVDFYARKAGLVVEVDGETAHTFPDQIRYDHERDGFLEGLGLKVLRFSARDVLSNIEGVISEIIYNVKEVVPDNFPRGQWRYAKNIQVGDEVFLGCDLLLNAVVDIREIEMACDVTMLDLGENDNFISNNFIFHI
jgi:very-short-patch-repair endonuclease